ncbi:helix-turn-helix domain-containing protein [Listeria grandensis]|uniref:helix-turn-helix domain-containing protein n=1 Tax=Listeria grandensis TaxID=1494963 RepID=UPI00164D9FFA|nr:helix-turn-helix transcriptional regulator [Listeria grandensis]MBC6314040.1 helix-turn-helix transcriptional regulator [Listeria grandensis]
MNIRFRVGHVIKRIRTEMGYSQEELCDGICNINSIARIESNKTSPSFEILLALVERLGVSIEKIIAEASLEQNRLYTQQRMAMEQHAETNNWVAVKEDLKLIDDVMYQNLSIKKQQIIDIMRIEVLTSVDGEIYRAKLLAEKSLYKSYKDKATYYTDEEIKLINIVLRYEQSPSNIERAENALAWMENQNPYLQDNYLSLFLLNGLMITAYMVENWKKVLEVSSRGLQIAEQIESMKFIPNFLFLKGFSLYMMNIERDKGKVLMQEAFKVCEISNHMYIREGLIDTLMQYNIAL